MADNDIDPEQVCRDIDAIAEQAQAANPDEVNTRGDCIRLARERIARFLHDLDMAETTENWSDREKIGRIVDLDDLLNASIEPTNLKEAQIYRLARQALPRHRR